MAVSVLEAFTPEQGTLAGSRDLTLPAGADKLLVVGILRDTATAIAPTVTFGGVALTQAEVTTGTGQSMWVGYVVAGATTGAVSLAISGMTMTLSALVPILLAGVDQSTPLVDSALDELASANIITGTAVSTVSDGMVISFAGLNNISNATIVGTGSDMTSVSTGGVDGSYTLTTFSQAGAGSSVIAEVDWNGNNRASLITTSFRSAEVAAAGGGLLLMANQYYG